MIDMAATRSSNIPIFVSFLVFGIFLIPVVYLFGASFLLGYEGITLEKITELINSPDTGVLLFNTLAFGVFGGGIATALGLIYAWITGRTNVPGKKFLESIPVLSLTMPFIVKAFAFIALFSPQIGLIDRSLLAISPHFPVLNIFTVEGVIFALGVGGFPLCYLTIKPAVMALDPSLEEASRVIGNRIPSMLRRITLPLLAPAILSAFLLDAIGGFENFDYPFIFGGVGHFDSFATEVYYWTFESMPPDYGKAAIISLLYLVLTFSALALYIYATRKTFKFIVVGGKASQTTVHSLGKWRYPSFLICAIIFFLSFGLPSIVITAMAIMPFPSYLGIVPFALTTANFERAFGLSLFWESFGNAVTFALVAATAATLLAVILSYATLRGRFKAARAIEYMSSVPLAFPGIVYGLALFWAFLFLPGVSNLLYGTLIPLILAMMFVRLPYCVRMISGNLIQISYELEEASMVTGAKWWRTMRRIVIPLLRHGMLNSFIYTFVNSIRELGAIVLLTTAGSTVLTTLLVNIYKQHGESLPILAAASTLIFVFIGSIIVVARLVEYGFERRYRRLEQ